MLGVGTNHRERKGGAQFRHAALLHAMREPLLAVRCLLITRPRVRTAVRRHHGYAWKPKSPLQTVRATGANARRLFFPSLFPFSTTKTETSVVHVSGKAPKTPRLTGCGTADKTGNGCLLPASGRRQLPFGQLSPPNALVALFRPCSALRRAATLSGFGKFNLRPVRFSAPVFAR